VFSRPAGIAIFCLQHPRTAHSVKDTRLLFPALARNFTASISFLLAASLTAALQGLPLLAVSW
jgi:hypothetical protein